MVMGYGPTYETIQVKTGARRATREILMFIVLCSGFMFFRYRDPYENLSTDLLISVIFGVPIAFALWGGYRVLRFAIGR